MTTQNDKKIHVVSLDRITKYMPHLYSFLFENFKQNNHLRILKVIMLSGIPSKIF